MQKLKTNNKLMVMLLCIFCVCVLTLIGCTQETKPIGRLTETTVTKIVDGDTFYCDAFNERVRIIGVNCPEIDTKEGKKACEYSIEANVKYSDWLTTLE